MKLTKFIIFTFMFFSVLSIKHAEENNNIQLSTELESSILNEMNNTIDTIKKLTSSKIINRSKLNRVSDYNRNEDKLSESSDTMINIKSELQIRKHTNEILIASRDSVANVEYIDNSDLEFKKEYKVEIPEVIGTIAILEKAEFFKKDYLKNPIRKLASNQNINNDEINLKDEVSLISSSLKEINKVTIQDISLLKNDRQDNGHSVNAGFKKANKENIINDQKNVWNSFRNKSKNNSAFDKQINELKIISELKNEKNDNIVTKKNVVKKSNNRQLQKEVPAELDNVINEFQNSLIESEKHYGSKENQVATSYKKNNEVLDSKPKRKNTSNNNIVKKQIVVPKQTDILENAIKEFNSSLQDTNNSNKKIANKVAGITNTKLAINSLEAFNMATPERSQNNKLDKFTNNSMNELNYNNSLLDKTVTKSEAIYTGYSKSKFNNNLKNRLRVETNYSEKKQRQINNAKYRRNISIKGFSVSLNKKMMTNDFNYFTFQPAYESTFGSGVGYDDNGEGSIKISEVFNSSMSVLRGTFVKRDYINIKTDLSIDELNSDIYIPMITRESFNQFISSKKINGLGAHLLIELDDETDEVFLDNESEAIFFFNEDFREVDEGDEYQYILYVGLAPRNTLMRFSTLNSKEIAEKVIHLSEDEIFFDANKYIQSKLEILKLSEKNLLSQTDLELSINDDNIKFYNKPDIGIKSMGPGFYKYQRPLMPRGFRKYIDLFYDGQKIFVGSWDGEKNVEVPSRDFVSLIFNYYNVDELDGRCLVQVNLSEPVKDIKMEGETSRGPMNIDVSYLTKNGEMRDESTEQTNKFFVLGEGQGVINYKVEYLDGSIDIQQTYCSDKTYLVEQL